MPAINGTSGADRLVGDSGPDTLMGLAGDDTLIGGDGADELFGGDDNFSSGTGADSIDGGAGGDFINGGDGDDTIVGGDGDDTIFGYPGADSLSGGLGNDNVNGDLADIFVDGGPGNDQVWISGLSQGDHLRLSQVSAGDGNDTVRFFDFTPTRIAVDGGVGNNALIFSWNGFAQITAPVEVYLNQAHDGDVVIATGFQSVGFADNATSAHVFGSDLAETISTRGANDYISGGGGNDVLSDDVSRLAGDASAYGAHQELIFAGLGDDTIRVGDGQHYLRGDEGDDTISGGGDFDDINGNMGNDSVDGRGGDDWSVGGKGDDQLAGGLGDDIVWGNLGDDTCDGGEGADQVRGGQGNDVVFGGSGNDFVSGDRGNDTVTGGGGADIFHGSQDAGIDQVTDFSQSEGDRVQLDPGTTYTVGQVGADTVIDMGGGHQMILKGVTFATLKDGWLFGTDPPPSHPPAGPPSASISQPGMSGFVYDPRSGLAYTAASDGVVRAWDFVHGTYQTVAQIGGNPTGITVTSDGRYLLVGDSGSPFTGADHTFSAPRTDTITRIDLQTRATEQLHFTVQNGETGVSDLVAAPNGQAYLTEDFSGSGTVQFRTFAAGAANPTFANANSPFSIGQSSALVLSEHGRYIASFDVSTSPASVSVFDTLTGHNVPQFDGYPFSTVAGANIGTGDISEAAGKAVNVQTTGIFVWNVGAEVTFAKDISSLVHHTGDVIGAHFSSDGRQLYLWDTGQHAIIVVDCATWTPVAAVPVQANVSFDYFSRHQGEMTLTPDGRYLLLDTGVGLEAIDLSAQPSLAHTGLAAPLEPTDDLGHGAAGVGGASGTITGNMDSMHLSDLLTANQGKANATQLLLTGVTANMTLTGTGFTYDTSAHLSGGTLQTFDFQGPGGPSVTHVSLGFSSGSAGAAAGSIISWIFADATATGFASLLQGNDALTGSPGADLLRSFAGNDVLSGAGGDDTLFGGSGDDSISAGFPNGDGPSVTGSTYLRGEDGDDTIAGGTAFDDINGNQGNDTAHGNSGDDWVVGGKDHDQLFGDSGDDIVWGNLGNDTLDGGTGADQVRGGQGDDVVNGGDGNDFVSGDRGNDTITGGAGADNFHDSQDAGIDRVLDFHLSEGDRVMLDPGTTFTVSQVGDDTVIDMGGGNQMILVGVQMSTLPPGTIFLG